MMISSTVLFHADEVCIRVANAATVRSAPHDGFMRIPGGSPIQLRAPETTWPRVVGVGIGTNRPFVDGHVEFTEPIGPLDLCISDVLIAGDPESGEFDSLGEVPPGSYECSHTVIRHRGLCRSDIFTHVVHLQTAECAEPTLRETTPAVWSAAIATGQLGFFFHSESEFRKYVARVGSGEPLVGRLTTTEDGNDLMAAGTILPVLGIQSRTYRLLVRDRASPIDSRWFGSPLVGPCRYLLRPDDSGHVSVAHGDTLLEWRNDMISLARIPLDRPRIVTVRGWLKSSLLWSEPMLGTWDFVLEGAPPAGFEPDPPLINQDPFVAAEEP